MDLQQNNFKKKLDFSRPTFAESEFKLPLSRPCREITNFQDQSRLHSEKSEFADDEDESSQESETSLYSAYEDKVTVFLRLKPTQEVIPKLYTFDQNKVILIGNQLSQLQTVERQYTFTSILDQATDQKTVFDTSVRPILSEPFSGMGAVFASYGVSNSGKTYTILGQKSPGVLPRALTQVFSEYDGHIAQYPCLKVISDQITILNDDQVEAELEVTKEFLKDASKPTQKKVEKWIAEIKEEHQFENKQLSAGEQQVYIWISFLEIYNEKMIDLFKGTKIGRGSSRAQQLRIISNNRNSYVQGLTWIHISTIEQALEVLQKGLRQVNYASTGLNANSSRSHTVLTIHMIHECDVSYEFSSYKFCDLAGAERISKTHNVGDRLKEAGGINTSLLVLGRCLEAVQHNQKPGVKKQGVPVRESKLTFLLQNSLMGGEKFVMIVNLLPTLECFDENINVLHFGSIANKIETRKTQSRKITRRSSRYTYFMQHAANSPLMNSSLAFNDSSIVDRNESSLDESYKRNHMSEDELRHELRKQDSAYEFLIKTIEEKEREFLLKEQRIRQESSELMCKAREAERKYSKDEEKLITDYYEKKMESLRLTYERKCKDYINVIEMKDELIRKLNKQLGKTDDDDGIINLDDDEEDYSENTTTESGRMSDAVE